MEDRSSIYQRMVAAGVPVDSHNSDLYVPDTPQVREIIAAYNKVAPCPVRPEQFRNQVNGEMWLDITFAFDPWWEKRSYVKGAAA